MLGKLGEVTVAGHQGRAVPVGVLDELGLFFELLVLLVHLLLQKLVGVEEVLILFDGLLQKAVFELDLLAHLLDALLGGLELLVDGV